MVATHFRTGKAMEYRQQSVKKAFVWLVYRWKANSCNNTCRRGAGRWNAQDDETVATQGALVRAFL